jgi:formate-dependent nitrite reductase membrane component NrfD/ferredoxin
MYRRPDGIVEFDSDACIGCKACMQACPYDAIYLDPETKTAAKCHYCGHRTDVGLEPACVVVCPTHSIWVGDLEDPTSGISQLLEEGRLENQVAVRAPEQKTGPNVFYLGATIPVLDPLEAPVDDTYIFSQPDKQRAMVSSHLPPAADNAKTTLNTAHPRPWGWRVTTYLWTKGVAAGVLLVIALGVILDKDFGRYQSVWAPLIGLIGVAATGVLLVWDLKRPDRFYYIFTRPNPRSWLFWGSVALAAFGAVVTLWLLAGIFAENNADLEGPYDVVDVLIYVSIPFAVMAAGYTAFLFAQAEGRDLWQSKLLFPHLLAQAVMVGAGVLVMLYGLFGTDPSSRDGMPVRYACETERYGCHPIPWAEQVIVRCLVIAAVIHIAFAIVEFYGKHQSKQASAAARLVTHGPHTPMFLASLCVAFVAAAIAAFSWDGENMGAAVVAGIAVQAALLMYESVFVRAGQDVPLS